MKKFKNKILILLCFTLSSLSGCCLYQEPKELYPPPALFLYPENYPERFKTIQRCTLSIGGRSMVFNGYIMVDRPQNTIKCVAQTDMGATIFKYVYKDGNLTILYCTPGFKQNWIEKYALRDATLLYLSSSSARLSKGTSQESIKSDSRLVRYLIKKGDKEIYTANFTYTREFFKECCYEDRAIPETITITDKILNYWLEIRVMDFICIKEKDS